MICDEIKRFLNDMGIKQRTLSVKTKIPENVLSEMLNGKRRITAEEYFSICEALGVPPGQFAATERR